MVDAFLIYDIVFSDDSDESDEDEFLEEEFLERFLVRNEEGEGDVAMEDEDEDEDEGNLALRTPMHQGVYVQEEGYRLYQKWRYAANKKTGWDFLLPSSFRRFRLLFLRSRCGIRYNLIDFDFIVECRGRMFLRVHRYAREFVSSLMSVCFSINQCLSNATRICVGKKKRKNWSFFLFLRDDLKSYKT